MDLILFSGQSNMIGQTGVLPENDQPVKGVWEYRYTEDSMVPLRHPVGERIGEHLDAAWEGHGSLIPDCCRTYAVLTGHETAAVPVAKDSTRIERWLPDTERYQVMIQKISAAKKAAGQVGHIYFVWLQGESNALAGTSRKSYLSSLITLKEALKKDAQIEKFGIIRVGYFSENYGMHGRDERIMRAQEDAVKTDDDFVMLTRASAELSRSKPYLNPQAPGHYNNAGMTVLGTLAGAALAQLTERADESN